MQHLIRKSLEEASLALSTLIKTPEIIVSLGNIIDTVSRCFSSGGKVLICGNGGSACDAMHFAEECTGKFRTERPALPVISLTDSAHITCVANDFGFEEVFSRAVAAYGRSGDILIVLSTSGNSKNIIHALKEAKTRKMITVGLLGQEGGDALATLDHGIVVPGNTTDRIQELHMLLLHTLIEGVESQLFYSTKDH